MAITTLTNGEVIRIPVIRRVHAPGAARDSGYFFREQHVRSARELSAAACSDLQHVVEGHDEARSQPPVDLEEIVAEEAK